MKSCVFGKKSLFPDTDLLLGNAENRASGDEISMRRDGGKKISDVVNGERGAWFWENLVRNLGDGSDTYFWDDVWLENTPLKVRFPRLYLLSSKQHAKISEMENWELGEWKWEFGWRRQLREWEVSWVEDLLNSIRLVSLTRERKDRWDWKGGSEGGYTVKKAYAELEKRRRNTSPVARCSFPFLSIWKSFAPFKAKTMAWRLSWN